MPYAVTHILIPLIVADLIKDYVFKNGAIKIGKHFKKRFPLYLVTIAGISGLLPDIDIAFYWVLLKIKGLNGVILGDVHRVYTHTFVIPLVIFLLGFLVFVISFYIFRNRKNRVSNKTKEYRVDMLGKIFFVVAFGYVIHLVLDGLLSGDIYPFYPFSSFGFGFNFIPFNAFGGTFYSGLDAILLSLWLIHESFRHNIRDYV